MNMIPRHADATPAARLAPVQAMRPAPPRGPFLQMHSGFCVSLTQPDCAGMPLSDIAIALSRTARFRGGTRGIYAYSVAQHCVLVADLLEEQQHTVTIQRAGLLHDAHEALCGDMPTPWKIALGEHQIRVREAPIIRAIHARFGMRPSLEPWQVKQADETALATERRDLMAPSAWLWDCAAEPSPFHRLQPMPESVAYTAFMSRAHRLGLR